MKKPEVIELIRKSVNGGDKLYPLLNCSAKELIEYIDKQDNIINELEEYICVIEYDERNYNETWQIAVRIHNKLKELKGVDKE